jgi:hypothetical protein
MSTTYNGGKAAIDKGVFDAFQREDYLTQKGDRDMVKVRERIFSIVSANKVFDRAERQDKAVTRGELVARVFPHLPGPEAWGEQPEPLLAEAVYNALDGKFVWGETKTNADSTLQRMVGMNMGNGYVLCRTKIGKDAIPAVYITDDLRCIQLDFVRPDNESTVRKLETVTKNREMLVIRQPQNAARYVREYGSTMRGAVTAGINRLQLTAESVVNSDADGDDHEEGGEE